MAVVGGVLAMQAPVNAGLAKATGSFPAALVSFGVGTLVLAAIVVFSGRAAGLGEATSVEWYYLIGGLLGAAYVFTALVLVNEIGAGGVVAATVTGQLGTAVLLDRLGVLGLEETAITPERVGGVLLLLAGTLLIVR